MICLLASLALHKRALASFRTSHARTGKEDAISSSTESKDAGSKDQEGKAWDEESKKAGTPLQQQLPQGEKHLLPNSAVQVS